MLPAQTKSRLEVEESTLCTLLRVTSLSHSLRLASEPWHVKLSSQAALASELLVLNLMESNEPQSICLHSTAANLIFMYLLCFSLMCRNLHSPRCLISTTPEQRPLASARRASSGAGQREKVFTPVTCN